MGFNKAPDTGKELKTLDEMRNYKHYAAETKGWNWCDRTLYGIPSNSDITWDMNCFCEPAKVYTPTLCAQDGDDCLCNNVVFYMKKQNPVPTPIDFWNALDTYAV